MIRRLFTQFAPVALLAALVFAIPAHADAPGLQLNPLEYRDILTAGRIKSGHVDVANPGDGPITIETSVRGFRQTGTQGQLQFFDDPDLAAGITVDLSSFDLGPREAVRVGFVVDPAKLPAGGVYAAIFFRTLPPTQSAASSYVAQSANIGTLLELQNGPAGPHQGAVTAANFSFWQFGRGLTGSLAYTNTDRTSHPTGYRPNLTVQILPWGAKPKLTTGLVLPGSTRQFAISRPGSYLGLLPIIITDLDTHRTTTSWVFACTGVYQWLVLVLAIILIILVLARPRRLTPTLKNLTHHLRALARHIKNRLRRQPKPPTKRPFDGLAPKRKD